MSAGISLLIADDEAVVRDFIRTMVKKEGLPVTRIFEAANGLDALRLALKEKPDLAILDIRMPGLTGLEVAADISQSASTTSVYIISAYDEFEYARAAFKSGVRDYLLKPIRPAQIVDIVRNTVKALEASRPDEAGDRPPLVKAVDGHIKANLDQPLFLEDIAKAVFVSPWHLSRKFKSLTGRSLTSHIQESRLAKAAELLRATKLSITEIAVQVGFNNPAYFATCFKASLGQTPLQYRKSSPQTPIK